MTTPTSNPPLSPSEAAAVAALHARRRAIAGSEPAARCRAVTLAARELMERIDALLADTPKDVGKTVLAAAGLADPVNATSYGSDVFAGFLGQLRTLSGDLDEFLSLAGEDIPAPVPEHKEALRVAS